MADIPPLPSRPSASLPGTRGALERLATLPERQSPAASGRTVGLEDNLGLEPNAQVGVWYDVMSTWLSRVKFTWRSVAHGGPPTPPTDDPRSRTGYLQVEFLDGAAIEYDKPQPYSVFDDLINSSSKGQYIHYGSSDLFHQSYTPLSPKTRKVTAEMRRLRKPKTRGRGLRLIGGSKRPPSFA